MITKWWSRIRKPVFSLLEILGFFTSLYLLSLNKPYVAVAVFASTLILQTWHLRKSVA